MPVPDPTPAPEGPQWRMELEISEDPVALPGLGIKTYAPGDRYFTFRIWRETRDLTVAVFEAKWPPEGGEPIFTIRQGFEEFEPWFRRMNELSSVLHQYYGELPTQERLSRSLERLRAAYGGVGEMP